MSIFSHTPQERTDATTSNRARADLASQLSDLDQQMAAEVRAERRNTAPLRDRLHDIEVQRERVQQELFAAQRRNLNARSAKDCLTLLLIVQQWIERYTALQSDANRDHQRVLELMAPYAHPHNGRMTDPTLPELRFDPFASGGGRLSNLITALTDWVTKTEEWLQERGTTPDRG